MKDLSYNDIGRSKARVRISPWDNKQWEQGNNGPIKQEKNLDEIIKNDNVKLMKCKRYNKVVCCADNLTLLWFKEINSMSHMKGLMPPRFR